MRKFKGIHWVSMLLSVLVLSIILFVPIEEFSKMSLKNSAILGWGCVLIADITNIINLYNKD